MKKPLRRWRALTISVVFALSIVSPLIINHASPLLERKIDAAQLINTMVIPDDPEAVFEDARIVHNVTVNGQKGMRVHAKFQVKYGKGVPCLMIAYFYYDDSDNTRLKASSEADYRAYRDTKGGVSAKTSFTPAYDPAVYNDLQLFIPYEALNMASGDAYDLKFYLSLYDKEGERSFGKSGWYKFKLNMP
jgi:hypothetical protein